MLSIFLVSLLYFGAMKIIDSVSPDDALDMHNFLVVLLSSISYGIIISIIYLLIH